MPGVLHFLGLVGGVSLTRRADVFPMRPSEAIFLPEGLLLTLLPVPLDTSRLSLII